MSRRRIESMGHCGGVLGIDVHTCDRQLLFRSYFSIGYKSTIPKRSNDTRRCPANPKEQTDMTRMPTLFIPHGGGPCFFMEWDPPDTWDRHRSFLETLPASLPEKPKALLVISGHWEAREFTVQSNPAPPLLFDYNGFPQHTYELTWPAPGDPALATRVGELLQGAGFETGTDTARGFDHGVFVPLKLVFPEADIPTVQLSLRSDLDPDAHLAVGRALAPLRDEGVLTTTWV